MEAASQEAAEADVAKLGDLTRCIANGLVRPQAQGDGCGAELAIPHDKSVPIDEFEFRCQPFRA